MLVVGLLAAFAALLCLGPGRRPAASGSSHARRMVAVVVWLAASGLFAVYTAMFGSYNKTWGSLVGGDRDADVALAHRARALFGAELNAEVERSYRLRKR